MLRVLRYILLHRRTSELGAPSALLWLRMEESLLVPSSRLAFRLRRRPIAMNSIICAALIDAVTLRIDDLYRAVRGLVWSRTRQAQSRLSQPQPLVS